MQAKGGRREDEANEEGVGQRCGGGGDGEREREGASQLGRRRMEKIKGTRQQEKRKIGEAEMMYEAGRETEGSKPRVEVDEPRRMCPCMMHVLRPVRAETCCVFLLQERDGALSTSLLSCLGGGARGCAGKKEGGGCTNKGRWIMDGGCEPRCGSLGHVERWAGGQAGRKAGCGHDCTDTWHLEAQSLDQGGIGLERTKGSEGRCVTDGVGGGDVLACLVAS